MRSFISLNHHVTHPSISQCPLFLLPPTKQVKETHPRPRLQRPLFILLTKRRDHILLRFSLDKGEVISFQALVHEDAFEVLWVLVDFCAEAFEGGGVGLPETAADEGFVVRFYVQVVCCVRAFFACAGPWGC